MTERYRIRNEPKCPKCGSLNVGRTNEYFGRWEWVCCMAGCRYTWNAPDPQIRVELPPVRVRGFDKLFRRLGEILK